MSFSSYTYFQICKTIRSIPWCLSIKNRSGRLEYYKQYTKDGIRHQEYIRKADLPSMLRDYERKKRSLKIKREMEQDLRSMSKPLRREMMNQLRFFREEEAFAKQIAQVLDKKNQTLFRNEAPRNLQNTPITLDGTILDSKSEVLCYNVASRAGLHPVHNKRVYTEFEFSDRYRMVDLSFWVYLDQYGIPVTDSRKAAGKRQIYHEHLGLLNHDQYRKKQLTKLVEYRRNGIYCGNNLILTASKSGSSELSILKYYVLGKLISGTTALKMLRNAIHNREDY